MRLRYTSEALHHIERVHDFLFVRNPTAARRIVADIQAAAARLCDFPRMARMGDVSGTQEWVVRGTPYLIVYEVDDVAAEIRVLGVFHGAQNRQDDPHR